MIVMMWGAGVAIARLATGEAPTGLAEADDPNAPELPINASAAHAEAPTITLRPSCFHECRGMKHSRCRCQHRLT